MENGQRLLTKEDLCFVDKDIDTRPEDIKYSHHALPNGELVLASNPSKAVFEFSQADLNEHRILFKHIGAAFGRIMLWVSDGQYYASTELKVRASPPFIRVVNNSGLIVQRGDSSFLSTHNLSVSTNLNAFGDDISYNIQATPANGIVLKDDVPVLTFTHRDLKEESIEYRHNHSDITSTKVSPLLLFHRRNNKVTVLARIRTCSICDTKVPFSKRKQHLRLLEMFSKSFSFYIFS